MIGRTMSEYRLIGQIGGGGMGVVWKAEDLKLQAVVALKFLPNDLTRDPEAKERFLREARVAFSLEHPNICAVHGIGETDEGQLFIVMSYYEGETLDKNIARGPIDPDETRRVFAQLSAGLAYAHQHGVVHRDIKPANIMVTAEGTVKILDFGLARLGNRTQITQAGSTVGTIAYMSPEQARGDDVDARTDIWSAGVVLYEMLSGVKPFRGEYSQVVLYSILNTDPAPVGTLRSGIPGDLAETCSRCLEKDRERRPGLLRAATEPAVAPARPGPSRVVRWFSGLPPPRRLAIVSTTALAAALLVMIVVRPPDPPGEKSLVAVVPFRNLSGEAEVDDWLEPMQSLIDHEVRDLGVYPYDVGGLNTYIAGVGGLTLPDPDAQRYDKFLDRGIRYLINGDVGKSDAGYTLTIELRDLKAGGINETTPAIFTGFAGAGDALRELLPQVVEFLRVKRLPMQKGDDLTPWTAGRRLNIQAHQALMQAYGPINRIEPGGEKFLRRAIELDSLFVTPRVWLISSLSMNGFPGEATAHYEFLRGIEARCAPFEQAMIDWCGSFLRRDVDAQVRDLRAALEYYPGNNILMYNLGILLYLERNWRETIDVVRPAVEMRWQHPGVYWLYAAASMRLGRYDEALRVLEGSLKITPSVFNGNYALLAVLYFRKNDSPKTELYTSKFIQRTRPKDDSLWLAYAELGRTFMEEGFPAGAIGPYRAAADRDPGGGRYRDTLTSALVDARRFDEAMRECGKMLRTDPAAAAPLYFIGRIHEEEGRIDSARLAFERFLSIDSTGERAEDARQRLMRLRD